MRKLRCEDCGCALEPWDEVFDWPEVGGICEDCMEGRVYELSAREAAERMGVCCCMAEELGM